MRRHRKVVWSEGMFIAPQHFQQQERYNHHHLEQYIALTQGGLRYGLSTLEIDQHRLQIGKVAVTQCRGLFPDSTYFESTRELILDVKQGTLDKIVYLALPMTVEGENEYGNRDENRRYFNESVSLFDASDSGQNSVETSVAEPNVRLFLEGDEVTGMTLIPIAKILESRESGQLVLDQSFIPACLQYGASALLIERVKELLVLTQTRANSVVQRIGAGQDRKSEQSLMREYLWLQTLNRWLPWLHLTVKNTELSVDDFYDGLVKFSSELASFKPSVADAPEPLVRDDLQQVLGKLFTRLRDQLSMVQSDNVVEFAWDTKLFERRRLLRTSVKDIHLMENRRFVLAVESSIGTSALAQIFPTACTLCGLGQVAELVRNGLSGISLNVLPVAPNELKPRADICYVEIDTRHIYWQEIKEKREALAIHVDSRIPDLHLQLYVLG